MHPIEFDPAAFFDTQPFNASRHGAAVLRQMLRRGVLVGRPAVQNGYDVWLASFESSRPVKLQEALGLVDATITVDTTLKEATKRKYRQEISRLIASAVLRDLTQVNDLSPKVIQAIVGEATRQRDRWVEASVSKQRFRRSAFRYFFRTLQELELTDRDPAAALRLPRRPSSLGRPLTDDEMELCEDVAYYGVVPDTRPVALALAQTGAATGEIGLVHPADVDVADGTVRLPGSTYTYERRNPLTAWGVRTLHDRIADPKLSPDRPLVVGLRLANDSATAMVSTYLRDVLRLADLTGPDVLPSSVRAWAARKVYERDGLEAAASFLGLESFDRTADIIALERNR